MRQGGSIACHSLTIFRRGLRMVGHARPAVYPAYEREGIPAETARRRFEATPPLADSLEVRRHRDYLTPPPGDSATAASSLSTSCRTAKRYGPQGRAQQGQVFGRDTDQDAGDVRSTSRPLRRPNGAKFMDFDAVRSLRHAA